jgi:hypothetical protein
MELLMSNDWRNGGTLQYGVSVSYKRKEEQKWLSREFWGDNAVIDAKNYFDIIFDEAEYPSFTTICRGDDGNDASVVYNDTEQKAEEA